MATSISMRSYLRRRAAWVWNEQRHAFIHGLTLQEETLTEMLLLRMARDHSKHGLTVKMFNKSQEGINGADWEWIIRTPSCDVGLRVQAKRLYHTRTGKDYGGLDPASYQSSKLIAQAGTRIPIYVFFNHDYGQNSALLEGRGESPFRGRSYWGCSIASASEIRKAKSNKLSALKKYMVPWHRLVTTLGKCNAKGALRTTTGMIDNSMPPARRELSNNIENHDFMSNYLAQEELAGVAILDFSDFRSE